MRPARPSTNRFIRNEETGKRALLVDVHTIEKTYTEEFTENKTGESIITPSSGNRLIITGVSIHTKATSGTVSIDIDGKKIARLYSSVNNRFKPVLASISGDVDESVKITTTTGNNEVFVSINYIEVS